MTARMSDAEFERLADSIEEVWAPAKALTEARRARAAEPTEQQRADMAMGEQARLCVSPMSDALGRWYANGSGEWEWLNSQTRELFMARGKVFAEHVVAALMSERGREAMTSSYWNDGGKEHIEDIMRRAVAAALDEVRRRLTRLEKPVTSAGEESGR